MDIGLGFGPFFAGIRGAHGRGRRFKRGVLKFIVLQMLAAQPHHGYDLIRHFRHKGWRGGAGSIYPLLASLEAEGFVVSRDEGERRMYEITEKGRAHLEQGVHAGEWFEDEPEAETSQARVAGDLREAASRLMQAVAQIGPSSKPETVERVGELLDRTRKEIYALLAQE
jgi:DNA-binding PadR family transcriptional regulator